MSRSALFVTKGVPSVGNTTPYQRVKSLSREYDLTVFTLQTLPSELSDSVSVRQCPDSILFKFLFPLWVTYHAVRSEMQLQFVYTTFHKPALLAGILLRIRGIPWVADLFDDPTLGMQLKRRQMSRSPRSLSLKQWASYGYATAVMFVIRPGLRLADLHIFVPDVEVDYGFDPRDESVLSITNGVCFDLIEQAESTPNEAFTVVYVGHVQRERGAGELIDAARRLKDCGYDTVRFELVGPIGDGQEDSLNKQVRKDRLDEMVTFTGRLPHEEALNRVASADACVCILSADVKNYRRTYPIKLFEYMALAKPIIATDLPGIANVIEDRTNGLLIPPDSPEAIADRIKRLIEDPTMREALAEQAGKDAEQYAWEDINDVVVDRIETTIHR